MRLGVLSPERAGAALLSVVFIASGCERPPPAVASPVAPAPQLEAPSVAPASAASGAARDALAAAAPEPAEPFVELAVEGFGPAVVSVPRAGRRRPVVLATHGNYDRAQWQCEVWRSIVGERAFVLCPGGVARADSPSADDVRFTYPNNGVLEREIAAGLAALSARFGERVDTGSVVYTGFSLGAIMGVAIATRGEGPARFPALVLIEGGHDRWTSASTRFFAKGGGRRVLFACGQPACVAIGKQAAAMLGQAGVEARVVSGGKVGHTYDGPVADAVRAAFDWVVEGDTRFAQSP